MTTQAEQLLGARVTGSDGKVIGTVEQVFRDDADGTPAWARIRSGKTGRFVPVSTSELTADGLRVPFDSRKVLAGPNIDAGQHMSVEQAEEIRRYYGLTVPTQPAPSRSAPSRPAPSRPAPSRSAPSYQTPARQGPSRQVPSRQATYGQRGMPPEQDWLVRQEERLNVDKETFETGRVRLHKYVDVEPVEETVRTFHDEYDIERITVTVEERIGGDIAEEEQEIVLYEERPVSRKEIVPVERIRLRTKRIEEDTTVRDELRRERIEVEPEESRSDVHRWR
ncbi:MAG TPA: YsnF/AvaK domain-containing protein [Streptosporangiaceae bacterium]|nr:YsnF/AvaK domain-containing protein [Streptosporangiaceae bacterium]